MHARVRCIRTQQSVAIAKPCRGAEAHVSLREEGRKVRDSHGVCKPLLIILPDGCSESGRNSSMAGLSPEHPCRPSSETYSQPFLPIESPPGPSISSVMVLYGWF